jgi:hypothetical protein
MLAGGRDRIDADNPELLRFSSRCIRRRELNCPPSQDARIGQLPGGMFPALM